MQGRASDKLGLGYPLRAGSAAEERQAVRIEPDGQDDPTLPAKARRLGYQLQIVGFCLAKGPLKSLDA
jgi:hypothetical protein